MNFQLLMSRVGVPVLGISLVALAYRSYQLTTVEEAQGTIVRTIRALEESGQIVVSRGSDEYVE